MSGTIEINPQSVWMPAGWVYDNVLALLSGELLVVHPDLAQTLASATTEKSAGFLSLKELTRGDISAVLSALRAVRARVASEGAEAFAMPEFYPGFLVHIDGLLKMLEEDPRSGDDTDRG